MTSALTNRLRTFCLWLSLAVVLTCALGSFGSPVRASTGSAFNAFTSDVSLGPSRASEPEKERREQTPPSGASGQAKALRAAEAVLSPPHVAVLTARTELPLAAPAPVAAGSIGARAPPLP